MNILNKILKQIRTILFLFTLFLILTLVVFDAYNFHQKISNDFENNVKERIKEVEYQLNTHTKDSEKLLMYINKTFFSLKTIEEQKELLFYIASLNQNFMQLRYIDNLGNEIIRVNRDKINGLTHLVKEENLQNKSYRDYFTDSRNKIKNKVWFTKIDLNIEDNKIQTPFTPTLRAILPIYVNNQFKGLFVINYFMEGFLSNVLNSSLYNTILINKKGEVLIHYQNRYSWSKYKNVNHSIKYFYPDTYRKILKQKYFNTGSFISKRLNIMTQKDLILIVSSKKDNVGYLYKSYYIKLLILAFVGLLIAYFVSNKISSMIKSLLENYLNRIERQNIQLKNLVSDLEHEKNKTKQAYEKVVNSEQELIKTKEKLVNLNNVKSEFLANMSHEMRTPLVGIIGITDILIDESKDKSQKKYLNIVKESSKTLKNIINEILDLSKIDAGKMQIYAQEFLIADLVKNIKNLFLVQTQKKNLNFNISYDKNIHNVLVGDKLRVLQILTNIVGNSIKFTDIGVVSLKINLLSKDKEKMRLQFLVEDSGIGLNEYIQKNLYTSFVQAEQVNNKTHEGTGLGLTISKKLVDLMEGEISFESEENKGTKFFVTLDFKYIPKKNKIKKNDESKYLLKEKKSVLLIEDIKTNQIVTSKILENLGFEVDVVNSGIKGIKKLENKKYDILFMDIYMPKLDGYETTKKIRENDKQTIIIGLSAASMQKDREESLAVGMNDYLIKPLELSNLKEVLNKYFEIEDIKIKKKKTKEKLTLKYFKKELGLTNYDLNNIFTEFLNYSKDIKTYLEDTNINSKEFDSFIHKLKSLTGNIKLNKMYELCIKIENTQNKKEKKSFLKELKTDIKDFEEKIKLKFLPKLQEEFKPLKKDELEQHIKSLIIDLKNDSYIKQESIDILIISLNNTKYKSYIDNIKEEFSNYEYKKLIQILNKII